MMTDNTQICSSGTMGIDIMMIVGGMIAGACIVMTTLLMFKRLIGMDNVRIAYADRDYTMLFGAVLSTLLIIFLVICVCFVIGMLCVVVGELI